MQQPPMPTHVHTPSYYYSAQRPQTSAVDAELAHLRAEAAADRAHERVRKASREARMAELEAWQNYRVG